MAGNSVNGAGKSNSIRCRITRMNDYENEGGGRVASVSTPSNLHVSDNVSFDLRISMIWRGSIVNLLRRKIFLSRFDDNN